VTRRPQTFEQRYPTRPARELADRAVDTLSIHLPLAEHIRVWERTYLEAGGIVRGSESR
jgi:hypothetical protein